MIPLPFAVFDEFGRSADDRVQDYAAACVAEERERAALVCDDEARIRTEAGNTHPEDSNLRGRCFAGARAAINCAKGVRNGEVVPSTRADMIPLPSHPEPHTYVWTKLELEAIQKYGDARAAKEREHCALVCEGIAADDMTGYGIADDCAQTIRAGGDA
jgi:hypothetical protein